MTDKKKNILLIIQPERIDLYQYLGVDTDNQFSILWHNTKAQYTPSASFINTQYFWSEFTSARNILKTINPNTIIFYEINDLQQMALCITANKYQVNTMFIDHGLKSNNMVDFFSFYASQSAQPTSYILSKARKQFLSILKTRIFYLRTISYIQLKSIANFLKLFFQLHFIHQMKALHNNPFPERTPQKFILFNKHNHYYYNYFYQINNKKVVYAGIPMYDEFYNIRSKWVNPLTTVVFFESDFLESNAYGWTAEFHENIARKLEVFAAEKNLLLYIKLHPRSNLQRWVQYGLNPSHIRVIQTGNFTELYLKSDLIIAYFSTLLMGLICAKKNVVLVKWHPQLLDGISDFDNFDLMHHSSSVSDLQSQFETWLKTNKALTSGKAYDMFIDEFNFPFDGKATQRIIDAING